MDALRHQLIRAIERADRLDADLAHSRPAPDAAAELIGRPASSTIPGAASGTTEPST